MYIVLGKNCLHSLFNTYQKKKSWLLQRNANSCSVPRKKTQDPEPKNQPNKSLKNYINS